MASGGAEEDDGGVPLDIDNVHMLLQVEHEQIQKRTFTNWINAQLSKRCPPSFVSDLFSDLSDGSHLLDLLEVMSGQPMKRQRGRGLFQKRTNIDTALNFLKRKSIKLVNINIPDIIDGRPSIILGLIWTIILHCHIEELASTLSYSSCHSSLDSLASLDSWSGSPVPASPVPAGRTSPLHKRFQMSAKKVLLMWVRDQCQKVGCSISVKNFKSSWRSGEAFLAILCALRPQLVDLLLVQSRTNQENLEEAFHLAERELHIPRLLEPQDIDVQDPDEKSIMTYVAQFLQYSKDFPVPDDHLQVSPSERALEVTSWLQQSYLDLSEAWTATEKSSFAEKYQVIENITSSIAEQRRPVMTLLASIRRCPELSQEQCAVRAEWDRLETELQRCKAELDSSLPPPLDSVVAWLQRAEASLTQEGGRAKDHADAAKAARAQQDTLKTLTKEMSIQANILDTYHNMDDSGNLLVPHEKFDEIKRSFTHIRVTAKYQGIKLEYQDSRHTVLDLLGRVCAKVQAWKAPYTSQETLLLLLQDWHETVERQGLLLILMDALQNLKERAHAYTSKAALDSQAVPRQLKETENEAELVSQAVTAVRGIMERTASAWETYNKCLTSLHTWLGQQSPTQTPPPPQDISEWTSCQAKLNEAGNLLIEVTESSTSAALAEQLSKVNMQWAECIKRTKFEVSPETIVGPLCPHMVHSLTQEASCLLRQPLEVASVPLKANRQKLQLLSKKLSEVDLSSLSSCPDFQTSHTEKPQINLPQMLAEAERTCGELQRAASRLEGRLAELDHWSTDALDCYQHLKDKRHRGCSALEPAAKVLISRGLQLENQVVTEGQNLQDIVTRVQKTSPLHHLSTSGMQDRISESVSQCQEIFGLFSSLGFLRRIEAADQTQRHLEAGLCVVARTKHVERVGNITLQTQDPDLVSPESSTQTPQQRMRALQGRPGKWQDEAAVVVPRIKIQMLPQPLREPIPHIHSGKEAESLYTSHAQSYHLLPALTHIPHGPKGAVLSKRVMSPVPEEDESSSPSQAHTPKAGTQGRPQAVVTSSPRPPVMSRGEVHSKAQSMARSRLEKARVHLQGRILQAVKLFSGREISEAQAKKKQKALKSLQPAVFDEFLAAVEGFGAFCTGPELQDLMILSDSVRKQWEDVRREMAAFIPTLWSMIREGKQSFPVVQCETQTNSLHKTTDHTDLTDCVLQKQAIMDGAVESLYELCETLTPGKSSPAAEQVGGSDEAQEIQASETSDCRGLQLQGNTPLRATGVSASSQQSINLPPEQYTDHPRRDLSPVSVHLCGEILQQSSQSEDEATPRGVGVSGKKLKPSLVSQEQSLRARLLHVSENNEQTQAHIQTVVSGDTMETKQEAEWTVIPETSAHPQEEHHSGQEVLERMTSLESSADLMALITDKLERIIRESVDISSFSLADPRLMSDLKEMDDRLRSETRKLSEQDTKGPKAHCHTLHNTVRHLEQLRQRLEEVQSAARALDHFLATVREVEAEIPTRLAEQNRSRQLNEADWEPETHSWQPLQTAVEESESVDGILKAAGMTLTMGGALVTCRKMVTSLSRHAADEEGELKRAGKSEDKLFLRETITWDDSTQQREAQEQDHPIPSRMEEEAELEAKRRKLEGDDQRKTQECEGDVLKNEDQGGRTSSPVKKKESLIQRVALLSALREIRGAAQQLRLQEPTLPALQHRSRALMELESRLAGHLTELQNIQEKSSQQGVGQTREVEDVWEEAKKAVAERLEQCCTLTELLKRFQSLRGELSGTLQRAESTISARASYMVKDNLQRLHTKVQVIKVDLSGLGDRIEEVRSVCRKLHTHLRQIPECTIIPFEEEADALMDRWLDISEKTDLHLENLHLGLTRWDSITQLGADVERWTADKLAMFAQSPSFQTDEDIRFLQNEIVTHEENMEHFHQKVTEIQVLLHSTEPPLELQVVETQTRKKMEQLKELISEAEDVYRQTVAAKGQITARMAECFSSLQKIQDSLQTLSASDIASVLAKLKDLLFELKMQDEQADSLLEDLRVMTSIVGPVGLQSLSVDGIQLVEKVRNTQQLFSEVEEQTERNIQALNRLQTEAELFEQWLQGIEEKAAKEENLTLLQEETLQQRARTAALALLVSSLQSSALSRSAVVEASSKLLERYHRFHTNVLHGSTDEVEAFGALVKTVQPCVGDQTFGENLPNPVEQRLGHTPVNTEGEAQIQELRLTGALCVGDCLKQDVQESEKQWRELLQSGSSVGPDLPTSSSSSSSSSCSLTRRQQASLEEQRRALAGRSSDAVWNDSSSTELERCRSSLMDELKSVCSHLEEGVCDEELFGQSLQDCRHKLTSLQERMSACQAQKEASAGPITDVPALEALLQELTDLEKEILQIVILKDSIAASCTAEVQASLSQQVSNLQIHKRALDSSIRESLVRGEVSCLQTALNHLTDHLRGLCEGSPDISQLKLQWCTIQDCGTRLSELAARVHNLQQTGEEGSLPEDVALTFNAIAKDLDRLKSIFLQKKQMCVENTVDRTTQIITQLQLWSRAVQAEPPSTSQAALGEGLRLQQALGDVLTEPDFLLNCLETHVAEKLERIASDALNESTHTHEGLSEYLVLGHSEAELDADLPDKVREDAVCSASPPAISSQENSEGDQSGSKLKIKDSLETTNDDDQPSCTEISDVIKPQTTSPKIDGSTADTGTSVAENTKIHFQTRKPDNSSLSTPEITSECLAAQSETLQTVPGAQEMEKHSEDLIVTSNKVFTIVLDMDFQLQDNCRSVPDNKSGLLTTSTSPESEETVLKVSQPESCASTPSACAETCELMNNDTSNSSNSHVTSAETTSQDVKQEEMTDLCHTGEETMESVLSVVEGQAVIVTQIPTGDTNQIACRGQVEEAEAVGGGPECPEFKPLQRTQRRDKAELLFGLSSWKLPESTRDMEVTHREHQIQGIMDPERTAPGLATGLRAGEAAGRSPQDCKSTMQEVLSETQSLVERSNIINRTPHIDLNWYLKSSPGEPEIRLVRTVREVLGCRYQPARLDVAAMAKQLQEAEDYRRCVQEQVATMKSTWICHPGVLKRVEAQWSAALLDASATVQVKAAQLDQVKQYHAHMKLVRAFLEVVAAQKNKMRLSTLGSSSLQADKLQALLQTMAQKKDTMEELLRLSSQLSGNLSDPESSGALLAQLGDVQEEWRLLEGSIKRALRHASSSTSQSALLINEAEQLKHNLEALGKSIFQSSDNKNALEFVCLTADLKVYHQLYLHLQSQSDALVLFPLGQKEKDKLKRSLQELSSLLNVTTSKLDTATCSHDGVPSGTVNKQLEELIVWAKQAENHISTGKKLALFPEEARIQIAEMKKFQTDIWFRRSRMQVEVEQVKEGASATEKAESDRVLKTVTDLYEAISDVVSQVLDTMKKDLQEREKLLSQLTNMDAWLAETHAERDPCNHVGSVSKADIRKLEAELKSHKVTTAELEKQLKQVEATADSCREIAVRSSPGESRYLVNRLSGLWTELDGLLAHQKAASWELEELIHERNTSDNELSTIQASLTQISTDLEQQRFPLTQETLSTVALVKHMLMEHQCQVQELQHCQEARRSSLLCGIRELQDQCKALSVNALEQDKYLHLRRQMDESRDIVKEQVERAKDETISVCERVTLCQTLLVELPLVKTQCQEVADQLAAISQELSQSELDSENQRIHGTVESLVSWENHIPETLRDLEVQLLAGLRLSSELPALTELFQSTREELEAFEPVNPDERDIDVAIRRNWVIWRHMESGMRVLEGLGRKEEINLKEYEQLYSLKDATMKKCHLQMESLCQARESLKDYQWAAQGAIGFLHNAEATFLSAPGGFLDCTEEQRQTQEALQALEDGFQAHICHLVDLVPQQPCLSRPKTEQLHTSILSQLLVGRAMLEAQAKLRLESLQRCEIIQRSHRKCHEDLRHRLSGLEAKLSECAAEQVTSYGKCVAQQNRAKLLTEDLRSLAGKIDELRAGCPIQGCGVGKDGELGALWRRWVSIRRGVGLLMAHAEQRGEEWKDITHSMEQCCSFLARLQADVPDSSAMSFAQEEPLELLAQAKLHQTGLQQEQQALASLEHRLEHALSLSSSQESIRPGPLGKTLVKIQENLGSLKERNLQVVAAARAEESERRHFQEEIADLEQQAIALLSSLETCTNPQERQELRKDLSSHKAKLESITDALQNRYAETPADISRRLQEVQLSLQREEEKLTGRGEHFDKLTGKVSELSSGLEKVKVLLEQRSPTVSEAQNVLKRVWDELDLLHSRLMLLENEVQDLAEEHPDQAHMLMDQLIQPLQLYQNAAQMTEQRTAFLNKIPACIQEFEDIMYGATCWLDEAQSWLSAPCSFTTARSLQNHASSLQLVLDDSERIRNTLQDFRPVLDEIATVCDISSHEERVNQSDQQVDEMQSKILEPLEQLLHAAVVVEEVEAELKTMEKNVPKIRAILSSMDNSNITLTEHLHNRQVILANMQSMRRTIEEMEKCKGELHLLQGSEESLLVFSRARVLLQSLEELEQLTQQQAQLLQDKIREGEETCKDIGVNTVPGEAPGEAQQLDRHLAQESNSEEEEEEENSCYSSTDTLTSSIPEDPEETLSASDEQKEDNSDVKPEVQALESLTCEVEMSSEGAEAELLSVNSGLHMKESEDAPCGLSMTDSSVAYETVTAEQLVSAALPGAEDEFAASDAVLDQHRSPEQETLSTDPHAESLQAAAAVENTRQIPGRPITPFTALRGCEEFVEEGDEHPHQHLDQASNQLCILDQFELGQSEMFPSIKEAPSLERCVLGRHQTKCPGVKAELQQASRSLLQGITRLLDLGEECITEWHTNQAHNQIQLQAVLCRHKELLRVLRSQLAFVQHLFQREPEALECQEDERVRLEVRAKALQQRALEQEVASLRRIQEWTRWEDNCSRLGGLLDDVETFISSGEPEREDEESTQLRRDTCQQTLDQLDKSRVALGLLLDQREALRTESEFASAFGRAGDDLELRWLSAYRRTEQESQRWRGIQESRARFQTDFASVSEWLLVAKKHQKTWSNLADMSDLNQESVRNNLIKLLDFSMETEAVSAQRASASREAAKLLRLKEADCPDTRAQLTQMEVNWSQLTSDLSKIQDCLQQRLLAVWPPVELLVDLEDWLETLRARLNQEEETLHKAEDAAQMAEVLQHYQELKAGLVNGQLLLDFLCQSGPQAVGLDVWTLRSQHRQHTMFAEKLGAVRLQWLDLQRELERLTREAELKRHTCADRERRLERLHGWIDQQKRKLHQWKQPSSQTAACEALQQLEDVVSRGKEVAAELQELKIEKEEGHPCDASFSDRTERLSRDCVDLSQQMVALRSALRQSVEEWSCFERDLREVSLHTTRVRCALQHQPLFSLMQAEGRMDLLEQLQKKAEKGEELWTSVDKSYNSLVKTPHRGAAQALDDHKSEEWKKWEAVLQELKEEHTRSSETLTLWREYVCHFDRCALHLQTLWCQWEELSGPKQDTQSTLHSLEEFQDAVEDLQSSMADVLRASKPLYGRLELLAANLLRSETRLLSRDVLLLSQATSGKKKSLQEDLERQQVFHTLLDALEKKTQKLKNRLNDTDSYELFLELCDLFPSFVDVREMSCYVALSNREMERLHMLIRLWTESMNLTSNMSRALWAEHQSSQNFQEKFQSLTSIQKKLEEESVSKNSLSFSSLKDMLTVHQRLEAEIITGHQLVKSLLCDVASTETGEKRSELEAQVSSMRQSWLNTVALAGQRRSWTKEHLDRWKVYRQGANILWKLLKDVDPLLPPAGPDLFKLHQLRSCMDDNQCVKDALDQHSTVYTQTLEAGRRLCETSRESDSQLQSELQALQEAWDRTASLLERRTDLVSSAVQTWSQCQDQITSITSELEQLEAMLKLQDSEGEKHIQQADLSLQRLTSGFRELATMKTDLSQYIAAGDSALLEQQLEQLHNQWEELCMKVSLRRQEIADRLNAWNIFNDKNKEFCDWLTQMENKVCLSGDLSIEEMVEKLKKDCMEEINLFSENKSHLKKLGEQLLSASDEATQTQVHGSLQEVNQRWHNLFHQIEARVKKLKETLVAVQQLDKNMNNLRSWLSRIEAELSRPITYSVCHHQEIQRRLAEQQELQRDIEQHTEGVASVLSLCDVLLRDEDAAGGGTEVESDSLQETSQSLDQRWRAICAMALERRLRIEETWRLWCKFLDDYSRFEDWLKMSERTAANPNSADVLYTVAKEELKKFEGFQRQVHERLTHLELVNNQYRRLSRENRTDRASQLKAMVTEGNRRWDTLHRRVAAILRRLKHFTGQREDFEGTRESMLVWLTELDLQLTNVEHFSESDVHHKIQQLNSFQKEITLNTERIDSLIVFGEGLIQKSSLQDAALIEDELEELHSYCQEVFGRLVRFHQRLSQPPIKEESEVSGTTFSLESSLELIGRPWLGRSLPATPTHLLASPLERSGRETPASVDSLPLEWDHTGDVGGSSSHEDDEEEEEEEHEDERAYFSALSEVDLPEIQEEFVEAPEALRASSLVSSRSVDGHDSPRWRSTETQLDPEEHSEAPNLTSTPLKQGYLRLMSQCSGSIEDIKRVSLILDYDEQPEELGLTGLATSDKQSGVIERWELIQAQSGNAGPQEPRHLTSDLDNITSWLGKVTPELERLQRSDPAASIEDMAARAKELKEMQKTFSSYKSVMLSVNLQAQKAAELQERLAAVNRDWSRACTDLQQWDTSLRKTLLRCQEFHETLHSLLLWLAHAESRRYAVDISDPETPAQALQQHCSTLTELQEELQGRLTQQASLQALWSQLQPEDEADESREAQEKLHVTGSKLKLLLRQVDQDLSALQQRLASDSTLDVSAGPKKGSSTRREKKDLSPPRSFFYRVLRAAFPLQLLILFLLLLPCLIPQSEGDAGCTGANNFARSFYPMLRYTNGPPPT